MPARRPGRLCWDSPADPPPSARPPYVRAGGAQGGLWRFHAEGSPVCPPPAPPGPCVQVSGCRVTRAGSVLGAHCPAWSPAHTCHSLRLSAGPSPPLGGLRQLALGRLRRLHFSRPASRGRSLVCLDGPVGQRKSPTAVVSIGHQAFPRLLEQRGDPGGGGGPGSAGSTTTPAVFCSARPQPRVHAPSTLGPLSLPLPPGHVLMGPPEQAGPVLAPPLRPGHPAPRSSL